MTLAPTTLRLTRQALAEFLRWRLQDESGRRYLERHWPEPLTAALRLLESNLQAIGSVDDAIQDDARRKLRPTACRAIGTLKPLLDRLFQGLHLDELALPDLVRACRVSPFREGVLEEAIRERFRAAWAANKNRQISQQRKEQGEMPTVASERCQERVKAALLRRGIKDLSASIPADVKRAIGQEVGFSVSAIGAVLAMLRREQGLVVSTVPAAALNGKHVPEEVESHASDMAAVESHGGAEGETPARARPSVVCLCGSTKFKQAFIEANFRETMAGRIVLSVGWYSHTDAAKYYPTPDEKAGLDQLHFRKIELADEVLILDVDGYVGESTRNELQHAQALGKRVRRLSEEQPDYQEPAAEETVPAQRLIDAEQDSLVEAARISRLLDELERVSGDRDGWKELAAKRDAENERLTDLLLDLEHEVESEALDGESVPLTALRLIRELRGGCPAQAEPPEPARRYTVQLNEDGRQEALRLASSSTLGFNVGSRRLMALAVAEVLDCVAGR